MQLENYWSPREDNLYLSINNKTRTREGQDKQG
jgi:hypothetical protein